MKTTIRRKPKKSEHFVTWAEVSLMACAAGAPIFAAFTYFGWENPGGWFPIATLIGAALCLLSFVLLALREFNEGR